jgi:CheY-like chemotaxis protein
MTPSEDRPASAANGEPAGILSARPRFCGVHVLVVEDDPINQQIALGQLASLGITAELAPDGLSALQALERQRYDVILMDCQLPGIDGYEVTRRLRHQEGVNRRTPVIAVTANAQKGQRERCLAAGMDQYLPKPLNLEILSGLLRRLLAHGTARQDARDSTSTVLDPKQIAALRELERRSGNALLAPLAESFPKQVHQYLEKMREATRNGDGKALFFAAHTLKGAAFNLGALELASLCREIEDPAQQGETGGFDKILGQIEGEVQKVILELKRISGTSWGEAGA